MKKIAIVGSNNLSERLIYYFEEVGYGKVIGMFDDFESINTIKYDRPIIGKVEDIPGLFKKGAFDLISNTIGYNNRKFRKGIHEFLKDLQIPLATFVHPSSFVEKNAIIKEGVVVLTNCTIDINAQVNENVVLSSRCFVSHDVKIGSNTYCAPAVKLAGYSEVGECCFLGINTTVIDRVKIGDNVQTAAGSVIIKDVSSNVMVAGVPAIEKKKLSQDIF